MDAFLFTKTRMVADLEGRIKRLSKNGKWGEELH
jgi:hypothetical protein